MRKDWQTILVIFVFSAVWSFVIGVQWGWVLSCVFLMTCSVDATIRHWVFIRWLGLGQFLHRVMSPILFGVFYFLFFTPIAMLSRMGGGSTKTTGFKKTAKKITKENFEKMW